VAARHPVEFKYRFEVLVPLADNDGRPFRWEKIERVGAALLDRFEGCRSQPLAPHSGQWRHRGAVYTEPLLLFTADAPRDDDSLEWMASYKQRLKRQFRQIDIYVAVTEVLWL
jgi:hypothetical protein